MNRYSPNPGVNETIEALLALGCPPIPVAPPQDPRRELCYQVTKTKDGVMFCRLDKNLNPIPKFTGKNPSFLKRDGSPWICQHGKFQNRLPSKDELQKFFCHPDTGVGTLGGHAGLNWLDFDQKHYDSQEDCDHDVERIISENNLQSSWIERTGSDGWRVAVKPRQLPTFTNFATSPDGQHVGEALFEGRFTVLAPTIHPNGKSYRRVGWGEPVEVESLQAIGIYPSKDEVEQAERNQKREQRKASNPHYGQPTNPQDNPWDIRNFAHYFEGYHERSDGWAAAKCPHHNGTSQTSFRIRLDTGEYKLWCGCNTKDVYQSGLALAAASGYKLPVAVAEPDPVEYAKYLQQEQQDLEAAQAESKERLKELREAYPKKAKEAWRNSKRFTADIEKVTEWFEAELPPENSIFFGKAGLGRGKSTQLVRWVNELQTEGYGFVCLGYRNTLLIQLCGEKRLGKLGFYHLHETDAGVMMHDPKGGIALCVDSLWRFNPDFFDGKILILDEVMSVIRHLLHSSTVKGRDNILELFHQALHRASRVICLDGHLADWAVKYLHKLAPDKKIIRFTNSYQGDKPLVNFLQGTVDIEEKVRKNDRSPWLDHLLNDCPIPAICTDSQVFAESLDNLLTEKGLQVLRIDSKTVPEQYVKDCLLDTDGYIEKHQPDAMIYTPSAESGVDVSIKDYFTSHLGFFFGVLGVDAILQMLGRIRDSECTKYVWVREWVAQDDQTHSKSPFVKTVGADIEQTLVQDITDTISTLDRKEDIAAKIMAILERSKTPHFDASNQIQAISNYEKANLRECVLEALKEAGYTVYCYTLLDSKAVGDRVKKETETTRRKNSRDIFTAEKIHVDEIEEFSKKFDAKWEDRVKVIQATYRSRLPGIDETESWDEEFIYKIKYANPDFINQQELYWLFSHPEVALRMNQERYFRFAKKERTFIGNIRSRMAKIKALRDIGIEKFLERGKTWVEDSPELTTLVKRCKDKKIAAALGKRPGFQSNTRFLGGLLKMLGFKQIGQKVKSDDGDYRIYHLDFDTLSDPDRKNALLCLDTRWQNYLTKEVEILDWDSVLDSQVAPTIDTKMRSTGREAISTKKSAQTATQQAFEVVPRTPSQYINNEGFVEPKKSCELCVGGGTNLPPVKRSLLARLTESLGYCRSAKDLFLVLEGLNATSEQVEDAIALQDTAPQRVELTQWWQSLSQPVSTAVDVAAVDVAAVEVVEKAKPTTEPLTDRADPSKIIALLKAIAENDQFQNLKELIAETGFSIQDLRRLSPKIQEVGGSSQPYKRLSWMLDALEGVKNIWVRNPYLELV